LKKKILIDNKKEDKKEVIIKRVKRGDCQLYADPHAKAFSGKHFEAQVEGDWVLYKGFNLNLYYRGKRFGGWVGQIQWGAKVFGVSVISRGFNVAHVTVDGQDRTLKQGRNRLPRGGSLVVAGNKITVTTNDGEEGDFISFNSFFNAFVRSNVPQVSGMCSQQFTRTNFFPGHKHGHVDNFHVPNCPNMARFRQSCQRSGLRGAHLRSCVFDRCAGLPRRIERRIIRQIRVERRKVVQPTPRRFNPRPARPAPRPRPFVARRPIVRRRGRGDVWMQTKGGKWLDVNDRGTFVYLEDSKIGLKIDVQFTKIGKGTVISAVALHARGKTIVAENDGRVRINGETVRGRKGRGALFQYKGRKLRVFKYKKRFFEFRGLRKDRLSIEYEKETKSYMIVVGSAAKHHVGLYTDPEHAEKYQIDEDESPFESYVEFEKVAPLTPTAGQKKGARLCCKKLVGEKKKRM